MTLLTIYPSNAADSLLTRASACSATTGGGSVGIDNLLGTALGYSEFVVLGNVAAWAAASGLGNPSGRGMIWDVTTLEQQAIAAGNWTPTVRGSIHNGNGNVTADIILRAWIFHATNFSFVSIGVMHLLAQSITSTSATYAFSATALPEADFPVGARLYCDWWFNVTANANTLSAATLRFNVSNSSSAGVNTSQIVTPGYSAKSVPSIITSISQRHRSIGRIVA